MDNRFDYSDLGGLIVKDNPRIVAFSALLDRMQGRLEQIALTCKPVLKGERYLTGIEVCKRLKISYRTLQEWRYNRQIGYFQIGGKILFRESDIQELLEKNRRNASK